MRNNSIPGVDRETWIRVFEEMDPKTRRWAFIAAKMAEKKKNFSEMAKRHRMSTWYMAAAAQGKKGYNMTKRIVDALEADLGIDLGPFLSPEEVRKINRAEDKKKPAPAPTPAAQEEAI